MMKLFYKICALAYSPSRSDFDCLDEARFEFDVRSGSFKIFVSALAISFFVFVPHLSHASALVPGITNYYSFNADDGADSVGSLDLNVGSGYYGTAIFADGWSSSPSINPIHSTGNFSSVASYSASVWFYPSSGQPCLSSGYCRIVGTPLVGGGDGSFLIRLGNGHVNIGAGGNVISGSATVTGNVWHHILLVYTGSVLKEYLDGSLDASGAGSGSTVAGQIMIGSANTAGTSEPFTGLIDDVGIFTLSDISSYDSLIWNSGAGSPLCLGSCSGGSGASIDIVFPANTSTVLAPFPDFITVVSGVDSSSLYYDILKVCVTQYAVCTSQPFKAFSGRHLDASGYYLQYWPNIAESNDYGTSSQIDIPVHAYLTNSYGFLLAQQDATYSMYTFKTGLKNPNGTTTQISGTPVLNASGTWTGVVGTSSYLGQPISPLNPATTTQIGFCDAPDSTNWFGSGMAYGACVVGNWLFNPQTAGNNDLLVSFQNFLNTPPFAWVYTVYSAITFEGTGL